MSCFEMDKYEDFVTKAACEALPRGGAPLKSVWLLRHQVAIWPDQLCLVDSDGRSVEIELNVPGACSMPDSVDDEALEIEFAEKYQMEPEDVSIGDLTALFGYMLTFVRTAICARIAEYAQAEGIALVDGFFVEFADYDDFATDAERKAPYEASKRLFGRNIELLKADAKQELPQFVFADEARQHWLTQLIESGWSAYPTSRLVRLT